MNIIKQIFTLCSLALAYNVQAEDVIDLCLLPQNIIRCEELANTEPYDKNSFLKAYKFIELVSIKGIEKISSENKITEKHLIRVIYILDEYINNYPGLMDDASKISLTNESSKNEIIEKIDIYKNVINEIPYSRSAVISILGVVFYNLSLCEYQERKNCDSYLKEAREYLNEVNSVDSSLLNKSKFSWRWYNDILVMEFILNLYLNDSNEAVLSKLKEYSNKSVVDFFPTAINSEGYINDDYIDQIWIGTVLPRGGVNKGYYTNNVVLFALNDIEEHPKKERLDVYSNKIEGMENDDLTIVIKSFSTEREASIEMVKIKDKYKDYVLSNVIYPEMFTLEFYLNKLKVTRPDKGSHYGVGFGYLSETQVNIFYENYEGWGFNNGFFTIRPLVPKF
ncbi:hypothetical protein [Photobacterium indicum]|uniref:Uncharacterized protein n=1 Tax=Photobacterium indicum TaxID=81447 RepID=A0A2T3LF38_9GAMM|nr:hypothetical protein [Photobacterium indicum]PSV49995.1 hypothetical protein C9J47_05455 [Photobacterium indicum]